MISKAMLVSALLVMTVNIGVAHADDDDWVGFYTAIDALDGSVDHLSIVQNSDGTYDIRMTSSALALCEPAQTAGWIVATGRLVGGNLVRENVMPMFRKKATSEWLQPSSPAGVMSGTGRPSGPEDVPANALSCSRPPRSVLSVWHCPQWPSTSTR